MPSQTKIDPQHQRLRSYRTPMLVKGPVLTSITAIPNVSGAQPV